MYISDGGGTTSLVPPTVQMDWWNVDHVSSKFNQVYFSVFVRNTGMKLRLPSLPVRGKSRTCGGSIMQRQKTYNALTHSHTRLETMTVVSLLFTQCFVESALF